MMYKDVIGVTNHFLNRDLIHDMQNLPVIVNRVKNLWLDKNSPQERFYYFLL